MRTYRVIAVVTTTLVCGCGGDEIRIVDAPLVDGGGAGNATGGRGNGGARTGGGGGAGAVISSTGSTTGSGGRATGGSTNGGNAGSGGTAVDGSTPGSGGAQDSGTSGASGTGGTSSPGDAGTCPSDPAPCVRCIHDRCCREFLDCNDVRCSGSGSTQGEFPCIQQCLQNQTGTLSDCADMCKGSHAVVAQNTNALISCLVGAGTDGGTGCSVACFGFVP